MPYCQNGEVLMNSAELTQAGLVTVAAEASAVEGARIGSGARVGNGVGVGNAGVGEAAAARSRFKIRTTTAVGAPGVSPATGSIPGVGST
jgi:hypothetical protein